MVEQIQEPTGIASHPIGQEATGAELVNIAAWAKDHKKRVKSGYAKEFPFSRRTVYQMSQHIQGALDRAWALRDGASDHDHLDDVSNMTEAIFHLSRAMAYLNLLSRRRYNATRAEDLQVYK